MKVQIIYMLVAMFAWSSASKYGPAPTKTVTYRPPITTTTQNPKSAVKFGFEIAGILSKLFHNVSGVVTDFGLKAGQVIAQRAQKTNKQPNPSTYLGYTYYEGQKFQLPPTVTFTLTDEHGNIFYNSSANPLPPPPSYQASPVHTQYTIVNTTPAPTRNPYPAPSAGIYTIPVKPLPPVAQPYQPAQKQPMPPKTYSLISQHTPQRNHPLNQEIFIIENRLAQHKPSNYVNIVPRTTPAPRLLTPPPKSYVIADKIPKSFVYKNIMAPQLTPLPPPTPKNSPRVYFIQQTYQPTPTPKPVYAPSSPIPSAINNIFAYPKPMHPENYPAPQPVQQPVAGYSPPRQPVQQPFAGYSPARQPVQQPIPGYSPARQPVQQPIPGYSPPRQPVQQPIPVYSPARQPAPGYSPPRQPVQQPFAGYSPAATPEPIFITGGGLYDAMTLPQDNNPAFLGYEKTPQAIVAKVFEGFPRFRRIYNFLKVLEKL